MRGPFLKHFEKRSEPLARTGGTGMFNLASEALCPVLSTAESNLEPLFALLQHQLLTAAFLQHTAANVLSFTVFENDFFIDFR